MFSSSLKYFEEEEKNPRKYPKIITQKKLEKYHKLQQQQKFNLKISKEKTFYV